MRFSTSHLFLMIKTLILTLLPQPEYIISTLGPVNLDIIHGDTISIETSYYIFTRTESTEEDRLVEFSVEGTAETGIDYSVVGATDFNSQFGSIIIPAGSATARLTINTLNLFNAIEGSLNNVIFPIEGFLNNSVIVIERGL